MKRILLSAVASALLTSTAYAGGDIAPVEPILDIPVIIEEEEFVNLGLYTLGLKVGTLGVGIDASVPLSKFTDAPLAKHFNLRGNLNYFTYSRNLDDFVADTTDEIDLSSMTSDGQIDLLTVGLLLDYYPFEQAQFRFTAGAYYNGNQIGIKSDGTAGQNFDINGQEYQVNGSMSIEASSELDKVAPYIGIGWGNRGAEAGWSWSLDIGALYQNIPNVEGSIDIGNAIVTETNGNGIIVDPTAIIDQAKISDELNQALSNANKDIEDHEYAKYTKWYPVIAIGVTYSF